ncbi:MAG: hypothetical protein IJF51_01740 [Clostridia bacterium]|nr:hypothetical protein [Clostridia bacterium]
MKRNVKMKILIAVVFTILILALIAGFFMNRRGNGEVRSAYDYTKVTTVTATKKAQKTTVKESGKTTKKAETKKADSGKAATTATTLKKSQRKITIPGAYVPIMNRYQEALSKKYGNQACLQNGVSNVLPELYEGTPLENVGFWVGDYNGDGTTDLLIGVVDGYNHYPYAILDYYTLDNNKQAYNVFQSQPKDYFSAISGKRIMEKISDNKEFTAWYLYGLNSNGMALTFKEGLLRDKYANKKNPWFKAEDMDGNTKNDTKVSNDAGKKRQKQFDNARVQLDFIKFSKFKPVAQKS